MTFRTPILVVLTAALLALSCGPIRQPVKPLFKVAGWQFQRADCESLEKYLVDNAAAVTLFEQLGGSVIRALAQAGDGPLLDAAAGLDYLGIAGSLLGTTVSLGVKPSEIPNTFLFRPFTCHEFVKVPPSAPPTLAVHEGGPSVADDLKLQVTP